MIRLKTPSPAALPLRMPTDTETVPLRRANGRVMAAPATAQLTQPPFAASAMDGYALGRAAAAGDSFHRDRRGRRRPCLPGQPQRDTKPSASSPARPLPEGAVEHCHSRRYRP